MCKEIIRNDHDLKKMLDELMETRDGNWWDQFYENKEKPIPFFKDIPDENVVDYLEKKQLNVETVLDMGCGNGRNAIYLAKNGCLVDAVDFSTESIEWAKENALKHNVSIQFHCQSVFEMNLKQEYYNFIYDGGLLHHIKPHRREEYLKKIYGSLKPNGYFGLTCLSEKGGANITDYDVYRHFSMQGGMGFSKEKLRVLLEPYFKEIELREMKETDQVNEFGLDILWAVLLQKE